jgi:hypothetical protein
VRAPTPRAVVGPQSAVRVDRQPAARRRAVQAAPGSGFRDPARRHQAQPTQPANRYPGSMRVDESEGEGSYSVSLSAQVRAGRQHGPDTDRRLSSSRTARNAARHAFNVADCVTEGAACTPVTGPMSRNMVLYDRPSPTNNTSSLTGTSSGSPEGSQVAAFAAAHTERLSFLVSHRPGFRAPTVAARELGTLDHFSQGRAAVHIITGGSDVPCARQAAVLLATGSRTSPRFSRKALVLLATAATPSTKGDTPLCNDVVWAAPA